MNYLVDIGHPAHVHLFKHISWNLQKKGHVVFFTIRSGEREAELISSYGFEYRIIGKKKTSIFGKLFGVISFTFRILIYSLRNNINLYISHGSMYAGYAAFIRRKPHIALEDSGNMEQLRFSIPVSTVVLTPNILPLNLGNKQITYSSYHELAYLKPNYFTPKQNIRALLKINKGDEYCILRFSGWSASHDIYNKGLGEYDKARIINYLSKKLKVFISSEKVLPEKFRKYEFPLSPQYLHDAIAGAEIIISEGATIAAESGVLGVPSIYINSIERCYNEDLERYGLVHNFRSPEGVLDKIIEILSTPNYKSIYQVYRNNMLNDKIDVTSFLTWFIETFPQSSEILRSNPEYQYNFE